MSTYGLWLSAAGMKVSEHRQSIQAHNLANAQTTGFKHDLAVVAERRVERSGSGSGVRSVRPAFDKMPGGIEVLPSYTTFEQGGIERTGKPLDVAIQGEGLFAVNDGSATRYTRDGEFTISASGDLVLSSGQGRWKVLDEGGAPIRIDEGAGKVEISGRGTVRQNQQELARVGMFTTREYPKLRKTGENLFDPNGAEMTPHETRLVTESREESTYDVMEGLTSMIEASRAYQMNATLLQMQDQLTGTVVSTVGRVA